MTDPITVVLAIGFGFLCGSLSSIIYLKRKMTQNLGSDELNPEEMLDQAESMMEDMGMDDMVDDMIEEDDEDGEN
jgi:uncharacterized protein YneF (UPF0154 family)